MDIIAVQRDGIGTIMVIIECKRYAAGNKVGVEIARGLYGVVEQRRATRGIIATTSFFTRGAVDFRNTLPHRIGLADIDVLSREINNWKERIK
jgi:restriction system protein